jgi:hypothetical protein
MCLVTLSENSVLQARQGTIHGHLYFTSQIPRYVMKKLRKQN